MAEQPTEQSSRHCHVRNAAGEVCTWRESSLAARVVFASASNRHSSSLACNSSSSISDCNPEHYLSMGPYQLIDGLPGGSSGEQAALRATLSVATRTRPRLIPVGVSTSSRLCSEDHLCAEG